MPLISASRDTFCLGDSAILIAQNIQTGAVLQWYSDTTLLVNAITDTWVLADEALLRIVIRNLVSNAIKFSRSGGFVRLSAAPLNGPTSMVRMTVRDEGIGIPAGTDLFRLGNNSPSLGTRGEKGTGLGLYLCRDIVSRHGGAIGVDSQAGAGAAFHFTLPPAERRHT